jgi:hypothetical protein
VVIRSRFKGGQRFQVISKTPGRKARNLSPSRKLPAKFTATAGVCRVIGLTSANAPKRCGVSAG